MMYPRQDCRRIHRSKSEIESKLKIQREMKSHQSKTMRRNPFQSLQNLHQPKLSSNNQSDDILVLKEKIIELEAIIEEKDQQIEEYLGEL